jgi:hypothetical protein
MPGSGWSVTEYRGPEGLALLENDWRRLFAETPHPLLWHSHEAYSSYLARLSPAPDLFRCFALSDGERVRAILPIEQRDERGRVGRGVGLSLRVWGMPLRPGWIVNDAICPDNEARRAVLPAVVAHMRRDPARPAVLDLGRCRADSTLLDGLNDLGSMTRYAFTDREEYVFPTDAPIETFMTRMSKNARSIVRRSARKFEALDGARYVRAAAPEELDTEYQCFLSVEASGWKGAQGTAIRDFPDLVAFYSDLMGRLTRDGRCEIHSLHAEGTCIAAGIWVYVGNEAAMLKCGYDEAYARLSPGRLMTHKAMEWACEDPAVDRVSLMSNAPWMMHWTPETIPWRRAFVSLRPVSGALTVLALRFWYGPLRRAVRRVRKWRMDRGTRNGGARGREAVALQSPQE